MSVSRALHQPSRLHPDTLGVVLAKVRELGYLPNESARSLASSRSRIVGAIVPTLSYSVYAGTLQGLSDGVRSSGYELMLGDSGYSAARERSLVEAFIGRGVDAIVLTGVEHAPETRELLRRHPLPVAETWDLGRAPLGLSVGFCNRSAGAAAGGLLASLGRRRWAFLGGYPTRERRSHKRLAGFRRGAREAGLAPPVEGFVRDVMQIDEAREAAAALLARAPDVDAAFCANDLLACALLQVAARIGRRVPDDLAVVGLGDFDLAVIADPALTTIRVPGYRMGRMAGESLLAQLEGGGGEAGRRIDLGFEIVRRETA
jgi:LacI family gluconate utilization system Gnt-I transcriptional repressor